MTSWFHALLLRIARRRHLDDDLRDELDFHLAMREAKGAPRSQFGNVTAIEEACRDQWTFRAIDELWMDMRYALRMLRKTPGYTLSAVVLLALGIAANTAIFSMINWILLRDLPVRDPGRLVVVRPLLRTQEMVWSAPFFADFEQGQNSFNGMFTVSSIDPAARIGSEELTGLQGRIASGGYFGVLGIPARLGRVFTPEEDRIGDPQAVMVISHGFWKRQFGGDPGVLGREVALAGHPFTIIGVAPSWFHGDSIGLETDYWVPLATQPWIRPGGDLLHSRGSGWLDVMGRLNPGVSIEQAQASSQVLYFQILHRDGSLRDASRPGFNRLHLEPGSRGFSSRVSEFSAPLEALMAIAALVLAIACTNIAGLMLARGAVRQRETAVRLALGAGRARLLRQSLVESLMLSTFGGVLGLAAAPVCVRAILDLTGLANENLNFPVDRTVLFFTAGVSLVCGLLFGLGPALRTSGAAIQPALQSGARATASKRRQVWNRLLVGGQVAMSVVLVVAAALFANSLYRLYTLDVGFDRNNVIAVSVDARPAGYREPAQYSDLAARIRELIAPIPGVHSVSFALCGTFGGCSRTSDVKVEGYTPPPNEGTTINVNHVSANLFETMGMTVIAGRTFTAHDRPGSPAVAVINETMAHFYFPNENPIGKRFSLGDKLADGLEIVGVVKDSKYNDLREPPVRMAFLSIGQFPDRFRHVEIKTAIDAAALLEPVRKAILAVDSKLRMLGPMTLTQAMDRTLTTDLLLAKLSAFFGALALLLTCIGVYGVISHLVVRKTPEIGIRMAVGAQPGDVIRMIVGHALFDVGAGVTAGLIAAWIAVRWIGSFLFGVPAHDPLVFALAILGLVFVTSLAAWIPARRAARIDPLSALRCD